MALHFRPMNDNQFLFLPVHHGYSSYLVSQQLTDLLPGDVAPDVPLDLHRRGRLGPHPPLPRRHRLLVVRVVTVADGRGGGLPGGGGGACRAVDGGRAPQAGSGVVQGRALTGTDLYRADRHFINLRSVC